jgi:iron(III) transport system permease protein
MTRRPTAALGALAGAVVVLVCLPLAYLIVRVADGGSTAWSVLERRGTLDVVVSSVGLVAFVTALAVAIGLPAAWLVARSDLPGRRAWGVLLALPLVVPSYVIALTLIAISGPGGLLGLPAIDGFDGSVAALALATYPYVFLLCGAALRRSNRSQEEAARSLGASAWTVARRVTLPALRTPLAASSLLVALYALSDFGVVSLMRFNVLTRAIFVQYKTLFDRTAPAVLALVLVIFAAVVVAVEARAAGRVAPVRGAAAAARAPEPVALGRWRWPALAFCAAVVGAALVLPVSVLAVWAGRADSLGDALAGLTGPGLNSLLVGALGAAVTTLCALPVAILAIRHRGRRWPRALERVTYGANALPGVVVGLALVFFAARYATPLYGTLAVLMVAYVVRFLPQALAGARSALGRVDPRLEDAARGLGRGQLSTIWSVTLPLVAPGLLAGATLVFLSVMKELPATLLLRPIGFETLATEVWTATGVSAYSEAAPPALALMIVAAPIVWLLTVRAGAGLSEAESAPVAAVAERAPVAAA